MKKMSAEPSFYLRQKRNNLSKPKFIKLTDVSSEVSKLNVCVDSIERFYELHKDDKTILHTSISGETSEVKISDANSDSRAVSCIHFKGHLEYHEVNETPEQIEDLIAEA